MREELKGIDYVFYFQKNNLHINMIELTTKDTVENTGESWCDAAYGNALIFLNNSQITDVLYLMDKSGMKGFNPFIMNREEQEKFMKSHAKRIVTRQKIGGNDMKLVKCIEERTDFPGQISIGSRYWMDEKSIWKDSDGDEYATFYTFHIPNEKYKIGQFKTSHFEMDNLVDCTQCIYSTYPKDCKKICMVVEGKEELK